MKTTWLAVATAMALVPATAARASVSYSGSTITQDFTGYNGMTGPTGWDALGFSDGAGFSENRGTSIGGETQGGTYAFDIGGGNVALGVQPGGDDFTPGYYQLEVVNSSGAAVDHWNVAFTSYVFNDQDRSNRFEFSFSTDGMTFTDVASGSFTSAESADAMAAWAVGANFSDSLAAPVANGGSLYLRWSGDDVGGSSSRDEFALDDVSVVATIPEPTAGFLASLGWLVSGLIRRRR